MRSLMRIAVTLLIATLALGCGGTTPTATNRAASGSAGEIRIASYDFTESVLLAEMYGIALRDRGFDARVIAELGSREVVDPALMQGDVDIVPEYVGTALNFLTGAVTPSTVTSDVAYQ